MTDADHDHCLASIELPSDDELENAPVPPPRKGARHLATLGQLALADTARDLVTGHA